MSWLTYTVHTVCILSVERERLGEDGGWENVDHKFRRTYWRDRRIDSNASCRPSCHRAAVAAISHQSLPQTSHAMRLTHLSVLLSVHAQCVGLFETFSYIHTRKARTLLFKYTLFFTFPTCSGKAGNKKGGKTTEIIQSNSNTEHW